MSTLKKTSNYLLLFLLLTLLINLSRDIWRLLHADERMKGAKKKLEQLEAERQELEEKKKDKQSDFYVEEQIRNKLGMAKPDEVILILPEELSLLREEKERKQEDLQLPNWQKWMKLFWKTP